MHSTMQQFPLTVAAILRYAVTVHGDRTVTTATGDGYRHATYREVGQQAARLANALRRLGVTATSGWPPSCGTTRNTWRPTSRCRRWARCCTP